MHWTFVRGLGAAPPLIHFEAHAQIVMSEMLNYRPSHSAAYYTQARNLHVLRAIAGFCAAAVAAVAGAFVYARIQPDLHSLYTRGGAVLAAAFTVGVLALLPVRYGRMRSPLLAAFTGAAIALIALYAMWITWVHEVLHLGNGTISYGTLIAHPIWLWRVIGALNAAGTWSYRGQTARGLGLAFLWIGEASALLTGGVLLAAKGIVEDDPICRECGNPCELVRPIARFANGCREDLLRGVENRDFNAVASLPAPGGDREPQLSLRLVCCPRCAQTNILTVNSLNWVPTAKGGMSLRIVPLIDQLLLTPDEATQLKQAVIVPREQPPAPEPEPPAAPDRAVARDSSEGA